MLWSDNIIILFWFIWTHHTAKEIFMNRCSSRIYSWKLTFLEHVFTDWFWGGWSKRVQENMKIKWIKMSFLSSRINFMMQHKVSKASKQARTKPTNPTWWMYAHFWQKLLVWQNLCINIYKPIIDSKSFKTISMLILEHNSKPHECFMLLLEFSKLKSFEQWTCKILFHLSVCCTIKKIVVKGNWRRRESEKGKKLRT